MAGVGRFRTDGFETVVRRKLPFPCDRSPVLTGEASGPCTVMRESANALGA